MERRVSVLEDLKARRSQRLSSRLFAAESLQSAAEQISLLQEEVEGLSEELCSNNEAAILSSDAAETLKQESKYDKTEIITLQDMLLQTKGQLRTETRLERETARDLMEEAEQARNAKHQANSESSWSRMEVQSVMTQMRQETVQTKTNEEAEIQSLKSMMANVRQEGAEEIQSLRKHLEDATSIVRLEEDNAEQCYFAEQRLAEEAHMLLDEVTEEKHLAKEHAVAVNKQMAFLKKEAALEASQAAKTESDWERSTKEIISNLTEANHEAMHANEQTQRERDLLQSELVATKQQAHEAVKSKERVARHEMRESAIISQQQVQDLQEMAEELAVCMPMIGEVGTRDLEIGKLTAELEARSTMLADAEESSVVIAKLSSDLERATAEVNQAKIERENFDRERLDLCSTIAQLTADLEKRSIAQAQPIKDRRSSAPAVGEGVLPGARLSQASASLTTSVSQSDKTGLDNAALKAREESSALGQKMSKLQAERAELLKLIGGAGSGSAGYPSSS
eukprot:gnl/MRDRNA2_/MRDRNA2_114227_c0_seq1.p1 gnl/MRDRNA2_/MRDRNA2_114227_c0~~gnl/MRDRNA2_/MRDRNA2_114227_c0_seq1.p1  ORF type:complete len:511 (-),score=161.81 gnl/MRDRNA2_/MRDRNA2_114227_c0_seq1:143-1675(-)